MMSLSVALLCLQFLLTNILAEVDVNYRIDCAIESWSQPDFVTLINLIYSSNLLQMIFKLTKALVKNVAAFGIIVQELQVFPSVI